MKLGFEETQSPYTSGSQSARAWTERWVRDQVFCPNCDNATVNPFPNNSPVADFLCSACKEEYELKSQKSPFGSKVLDGAFRTKCERLAADNNPNLFLLNYDFKQLSVTNFFVVPKHFFVRDVIAERKPLAQTARRAGWIGSHILLNKIPQSGKIYFVRDGRVEPRDSVLKQWKRTLFLRDEGQKARGWLIEVMKCVEAIGKPKFQIDDVYAFEKKLSHLYPENKNVKQRFASNCSFCEIAVISNSFRAAIIGYDRKIRIEGSAWLGIAITTNVLVVITNGGMSGRACVTTTAGAAVLGTCHHMMQTISQS